MKELEKKHVYWHQDGVLDTIVEELQEDRVVVTSTDTVLGLLAPLSEKGFKALNKIKKRTDKPYLILIGAKEHLALFVDLPLRGPVAALVDHCWPGPLTLIFKAKEGCPDFLQGHDGTIAIRFPDHVKLQAVLRHFQGLFSTSANNTGEPVPNKVEDLAPSLVTAVNYIVTEDGQNQATENQPSTILDCTGSEIRVVRAGSYGIEELEVVAGESLKVL